LDLVRDSSLAQLVRRLCETPSSVRTRGASIARELIEILLQPLHFVRHLAFALIEPLIFLSVPSG
jgi:hypothetical protein